MRPHVLDLLQDIYALYEDYTKDLMVACKRGCSVCCTQHVTMTTLEGRNVFRYLSSQKQAMLMDSFLLDTDKYRFKPAISTNGYAACCLRGEEPPDERSSNTQTECKFLEKNICTIYPVRPFGCRCFFSTVSCSKEACAVVEPILISVNSVFLQCIEHLDTGGWLGNVYDILTFLKTGTKTFAEKLALTENQPIPALMIPPEHRDQLQPIVEKMREIINSGARKQ